MQGKALHALVRKSGCMADPVVASSLVAMYAKSGHFASAIYLFEEMPQRDVGSWNTVISCYYQDGLPAMALEMFYKMKRSGFLPDAVTFTAAIAACARLPAPKAGKAIHGEIFQRGIPLDGFIGSALIELYCKSGEVNAAKEIFYQVPEKNIVCWNSLINGSEAEGAVALLKGMSYEGVNPTETTLSSLLMVCARAQDLQRGSFLHGFLLRRQMQDNVFIQSSLMELYFKCGLSSLAVKVFQSIESAVQIKYPVLWNVLISGHAAAGEFFEVLRVYRAMEQCSSPDTATFAVVLPACAQLAALQQGKDIHCAALRAGLASNATVMSAVLDMYAKCGAMEEARRVFDDILVRDLVAWTSMISAYGSHGLAREAVELFHQMSLPPDRVAFLAAISACSHGGLIEEGCQIFHEMMIKHGIEPGVEHYACMVDLLGRYGQVEEALELILEMPAMKRDAGILGSLFSSCRHHRNLATGEKVARLLAGADPEELNSSLIVLSNMYASAGKWEEVRSVRGRIKDQRLKKTPGCSWIEVDEMIHQFFVDDGSHPMTGRIHLCLDTLMIHMGRSKGYYKFCTNDSINTSLLEAL